jgi:hypothetical protein
MLSVTHRQAVAYRLRVNHLTTRLPSGSYEEAARYALQDSCPRSALISLHARVAACEPSAWEDPRLVQTYSPRAAVHVFPAADWSVFTLGRLPIEPTARRAIEEHADKVCRELAGRSLPSRRLPAELSARLRHCTASGRIAVRWDARSLVVREITRPEVDLEATRAELCRRHVHAFGPSTPVAFAWWSGLSTPDARRVWHAIEPELGEVELAGQPAWILTADETALATAPPARGVRLLPAEELRIFGGDRTGQFVAPSRAVRPPLYDTFHSHGLLVDGELVGSWSRRQGEVHVRTARALSARQRSDLAAEALALPIPGARMSVQITEP